MTRPGAAVTVPAALFDAGLDAVLAEAARDTGGPAPRAVPVAEPAVPVDGDDDGLARARAAAAAVRDPELPMLTLADLGVLRSVAYATDGAVEVALTPTYSGCPALAEMRAETVRALHGAGFPEVRVRTVLDPPWSTAWISEAGRRALAEHHIAPPGPAPRPSGPVPLTLSPTRSAAPEVACPLCGSGRTEEISRFSATSCRALRRCLACREPFEHVKEI
ncbi:1,2-phenylacetyl-CoA epoxidase subunit PaaD [Streptomyces sp. NPDC058373]|uniref:1,2-phenylacetyl-CoA epoxidase subunit PaaD n=1 Tax=Streptomyces sp. NPDC058373 TaxID=3346465 RepID=UPI00365624EB